MTKTENLTKHIEELEEKRLRVFLHMQRIAQTLNSRLYSFNAVIGIGSLLIVLVSLFVDNIDSVLLLWTKAFALTATILSFGQYLYAFDKNAHNLFSTICDIYKSYDDEYFVLKKFDTGEIDERLIRQYYIDKTKKIERYNCSVSTPGWLTWITLSLFISSISLLILG